MRDAAYLRIGKEQGIEDPEEAMTAGYCALKEQFYAEMSTEEALQLARNIVLSWDWEQTNG